LIVHALTISLPKSDLTRKRRRANAPDFFTTQRSQRVIAPRAQLALARNVDVGR
jgi:hypothetical protein